MHIRQALRDLRFGVVEVVVQDGTIVQINRTEKRRLARTNWDVFPETRILDADDDGRLAVRILRGKDKGELWQVDGRRMEILRSLTMEGAFAFGEPGGKSCVSQDGYAAVLWPGKMCGWRKQERNTP